MKSGKIKMFQEERIKRKGIPTMKITETRIINPSDLYYLCNSKNWYTCGTNAEYELMFGKAKGNMTTEKMVALAEDIILHSADKCFADCAPNGISAMEYVLGELAEYSHTIFEIN